MDAESFSPFQQLTRGDPAHGDDVHYIRYPLSLRQVEDLLFDRGIDICHETVRFWWNRFSPMFAAEIRKRRVDHRSYSNWRWHLDEVFVRINGKTHYLWRAVDHEGEVLEVFAIKSRDRRATLKFLKRAMKRYDRPRSIVTDRLRSYRAAMKVIGNAADQTCGRWLNNRVENSHQPFRRREGAIAKFRDIKKFQVGKRSALPSIDPAAHNYLIGHARATLRQERSQHLLAGFAPHPITSLRHRDVMASTNLGEPNKLAKLFASKFVRLFFFYLFDGQRIFAVLLAAKYETEVLDTLFVSLPPRRIEDIIDVRHDSLRYYHFGTSWRRRTEYVRAETHRGPRRATDCLTSGPRSCERQREP